VCTFSARIDDQFSPHDDFDYDSVQVPVLADMEWKGKMRRVLLWANRNGFYYVLDRTTGEFLQGNWEVFRPCRTESVVLCWPLLFQFHPAPPFFRSCDCTSPRAAEVTRADR
jgi:hypothetical protein